jgi:hypothetical protein
VPFEMVPDGPGFELLFRVHRGVTAGEQEPALRGAGWLVRRTEEGTRFEASPIGLYFSSLWYSERLYPLIFTVEALDSCQWQGLGVIKKGCAKPVTAV